MKESDFKKAYKLANQLNFDSVEVSERHSGNSFGLFLDDDNGYWSIEAAYNGKYKLCIDGAKVGIVNPKLEAKIDLFKESELNKDNEQLEADEKYRDYQNELWANYGYGKN